MTKRGDSADSPSKRGPEGFPQSKREPKTRLSSSSPIAGDGASPEGGGSGFYRVPDPLERLRTLQSVPPPGDPGQADETLGVKFGNLGALAIAVILADSEGLVTELNPIAERLTGWSRDEARGKSLDVVFTLSESGGESQGPLSLGGALFGSSSARGDVQPFLLSRQGMKRAVNYSVESVEDPVTHQSRILLLAQDVTEDRLNALRLMHLSQHDALTGLLNRQHFIKHLGETLSMVNKTGREAAAVFIDIDRFRLINDASGLDAGDTLLSWIASLLREVIGKDNVAARLGGNEFGLLLYDVNVRQAESVAREIVKRLQDFRFAWRASTFSVRSSAGVVTVCSEFDDASSILGAAEAANAKAKDSGGNRVVAWYEPAEAVQDARAQALSWVAHIKENLKHGRVQLYCQPIVPLLGGGKEPQSFEILFRMLDADGVARGPQDIIRTAERYGLMDAIDKWVVKNTLKQLGQDRKLLDSIDHCSINLSAMSLHKETILDLIRDQLQKNSVPADKICFEVTETAAVDNLDEARSLMREISELGCKFSLDDFGSGMASYAYLRELPVNFIKIDRSFVSDVDSSELNSAIIESIVHIASLLGARTVAEGVETPSIAGAVTALGIDYGQGWLYGRPRPL